jgi:hypothetical protein
MMCSTATRSERRWRDWNAGLDYPSPQPLGPAFRRSPSDATFSSEAVWRDLKPEEFLILSWLGGGMMPNFAWLTPRMTIEKAGPWNERLSLNDDGEFFCRVVLTSSGVLFCNDARGYYRGSAATLSARRDGDALASAFEVIELSSARLMERSNSASAAKAGAACYQRFMFEAYPDVPHLVAAPGSGYCNLAAGIASACSRSISQVMKRGCFCVIAIGWTGWMPCAASAMIGLGKRICGALRVDLDLVRPANCQGSGL